MASSVLFVQVLDASFQDLFDYTLVKIKQSGLLAKELHRWLEQDRPDGHNRVRRATGVAQLGFENLLFPAAVALAGVAGSAVLAMGEFVVGKVMK